ncbi:MAG: hypothetical protein RSG77_17010 [Hafnia sp.]
MTKNNKVDEDFKKHLTTAIKKAYGRNINPKTRLGELRLMIYAARLLMCPESKFTKKMMAAFDAIRQERHPTGDHSWLDEPVKPESTLLENFNCQIQFAPRPNATRQ